MSRVPRFTLGANTLNPDFEGSLLPTTPPAPAPAKPLLNFQPNLLGLAGGALCTYHGYKRNGGSVVWALIWGSLGTIFPLVATPIAFAQGFGKK